MILPKRIFPETFNKKEFSSTPFAESLPFHIKECGYIRERKLIFGKKNNFNDYLLVYTLDGVASYTKNQYTQLIQPHSISLLPAIPQVRFREIPKTGLPTILLSAAATPDFFTIWSAHKTILF